MKNLIFKTAFLFTMIVSSAIEQNKISLMHYDDDFTMVKKDSVKKGFNQLKFIPLGKNNFISFGGKLREQFPVYNNINFGDVQPTFQDDSANQLWHQLMVNSNIELENHFRFFIQLNRTLRFLNDNPIVPEIDENQLSLRQAFAELKYINCNNRLVYQEMYYRNHRLITV